MARVHFTTGPDGSVACGRETTSRTSDPDKVDCKTCLRIMAARTGPAEVEGTIETIGDPPGEAVRLGTLHTEPVPESEPLPPPVLAPRLRDFPGWAEATPLDRALFVMAACREQGFDDRPSASRDTPYILTPENFIAVSGAKGVPWPLAAERRKGEPTIVRVHVQHHGGRHSAKVTTADLSLTLTAEEREAIVRRKLRRQGMCRAAQVARWLALNAVAATEHEAAVSTFAIEGEM